MSEPVQGKRTRRKRICITWLISMPKQVTRITLSLLVTAPRRGKGCSGAGTEGNGVPFFFVRNDPLWQFLLTFHIVECLASPHFVYLLPFRTTCLGVASSIYNAYRR